MFESTSALRESFLSLLPDALKSFVVHEPGVILRMPAKAVEVGDLVVFDEDDEFTVVVGKLYHNHFGEAAGAIKWVQDIIAERVRFRTEFKDGQCDRASSWYPEICEGGPLFPATDEFREYTWGGQKMHERRTVG